MALSNLLEHRVLRNWGVGEIKTKKKKAAPQMAKFPSGGIRQFGGELRVWFLVKSLIGGNPSEISPFPSRAGPGYSVGLCAEFSR